MKKVFLMLAASATLALVSCGGAETGNEESTTPETEVANELENVVNEAETKVENLADSVANEAEKMTNEVADSVEKTLEEVENKIEEEVK